MQIENSIFQLLKDATGILPFPMSSLYVNTDFTTITLSYRHADKLYEHEIQILPRFTANADVVIFFRVKLTNEIFDTLRDAVQCLIEATTSLRK